jgi:hypothetical protein
LPGTVGASAALIPTGRGLRISSRHVADIDFVRWHRHVWRQQHPALFDRKADYLRL